MPSELTDAFRIERWGQPDGGGWLDWPVQWTRAMETALNVYRAVRAYGDALADYEGEALARWQERHGDIVAAVMRVERLREEIDGP